MLKMKRQCQEIAEGLLKLDNLLAQGIIGEANRLRSARWLAEDAALVVSDLHRRGILTAEEAKPFREAPGEFGVWEREIGVLPLTPSVMTAKGTVELAKEKIEALHKLAEKLLLEKVIACECAGRTFYEALKEGEEHERPARYPGRGVM